MTNDNFELFIGKDFTDQLPPCAEKYLKELILLAKEADVTGIRDKKTIKIISEVLSKLKFYLTLENLLK